MLLLPLAARALAGLRAHARIVALDVHGDLFRVGPQLRLRRDRAAAVLLARIAGIGAVRVGRRGRFLQVVGYHHEFRMDDAVLQSATPAFRVHQIIDDVVLGGPFEYGPGRYIGAVRCQMVDAFRWWARRQRRRRRRRRFRYLLVNGFGVIRRRRRGQRQRRRRRDRHRR